MPNNVSCENSPLKAGGSQAAPATPAPQDTATEPATGAAASDCTVLKLAQDELMAIAACIGPSHRRVLRLACKPWRAATDTFTANPISGEGASHAPTTATTNLRSTPPPPPLPTWLHRSVRRVELSFKTTPTNSKPLSADDQAALTTALSNLKLGGVAPLRITCAAVSSSGGVHKPSSTGGTRQTTQQSDGKAALAAALGSLHLGTVVPSDGQATLAAALDSLHLGGVVPHRSTPTASSSTAIAPPRTLTLAMHGYQATTKAIEDVLQQAGVLGAWPEVEVRPASLLLDGHLSEHLVLADVVGLAPGYMPGHATAPAYPNLRHLELTLQSNQGGNNAHLGSAAGLLLNQRMLPSLRHLQFTATSSYLFLPMTALDLPSLHCLVLNTPYGTYFERQPQHQEMSPYCGLTRLTQLTRLVYTPFKDFLIMRGIRMLEALPSLKELELKQVPTDAPFGHLASLTRLSISFSIRSGGSTWDMVHTIGHLTALRSLTLNSHGWASGSGLPPGALPALTELCFQGLNPSNHWDSLASALPPLADKFVVPCAHARQRSLRKVRLSPVRITSPQPEDMCTVSWGWAWAVKKQVKARPGSGTDAWEVEFEATDSCLHATV